MSDFIPVVPYDNLSPGSITPVRVGHYYLALYLAFGQVYCTDDVCTHEEARVSNGGILEGFEVECPVHGSRFDVRTGEVTMPPADEPLRTFDVEVREGMVFVRVV